MYSAYTSSVQGSLSPVRGVRAGILAVVASSDSEVRPRVDSPVDGIVQSLGHTTTQRHVGDGALMLCLPGGSVFGLGNGELVSSVISAAHKTPATISPIVPLPLGLKALTATAQWVP
jgi:hypothetical protein